MNMCVTTIYKSIVLSLLWWATECGCGDVKLVAIHTLIKSDVLIGRRLIEAAGLFCEPDQLSFGSWTNLAVFMLLGTRG